MDPERISACLIAQDEQERIAAALASVAFCDETIVVDGGSSDATVEVARAAGARVIENPWPGFAAQRNVALDAASGEWILQIDADERVSPALRASIQALLSAPPPGTAMAVCALRNSFLGGLLGPSAKYPAYRARVFRREIYRYDESREVHEGIEPRERPVVLDGDLEHELASSLNEALADTWRYARLESLHVARPSSARAAAIGIVLRPAAKLVYRTIVDGGWRDGWRGMLKISLDASTDGLVWMLSLMRGRGDGASARAPTRTGTNTRAETGVSAEAGTSAATGASAEMGMATDGEMRREGHFGRRPVGPPKVVALSDAGAAAQSAARWLAGLGGQGIDVALVCGAAPGEGMEERVDGASGGSVRSAEGVPLRRVAHMSPLGAIRALEIETQLRTIDAVVTVGGRARLVGMLVPRTLRPTISGLDTSLHPRAAAELVLASVVRR
jgi:glycosyltransferase involved in cell wall biosynthesis